MVSITTHAYLRDRYDDPDSSGGQEQRIALSAQKLAALRGSPLGAYIRRIVNECLKAKIECELVYENRNATGWRSRLRLSEVAQLHNDDLNDWAFDMLFRFPAEISIYLMTRGSFDKEKVVELLLRLPTGTFE